MKKSAVAGVAASLMFVGATVRVHPQEPVARQAFVNQYCVACHSRAAKAGGLILQDIDTFAPAHPEMWEKVIRKVRTGEMPPVGRPRADAATTAAFAGSLIDELDAAAQRTPFAGRPVVRRLNRTQYSNAIRDLLALELPLSTELPEDGVAGGFDNIGDALAMSPVLLERYLRLARKITDLAIGSGDSSPVTDQYVRTRTQAAWQGEEMPFGTRGGISVSHFFPRDAEYTLKAFLDSGNGQLSPLEGIRFFQTKVPVKAGLHRFIATFPDDFAQGEGPGPNVAGEGGRPLGGPADPQGSAVRASMDFLLDGRRVKRFEIRGPNPSETTVSGPPVLEKVEISGPYNPAGVSDTPSRRQIFTCRPTRTSDESPCATKILSTLARRAFRRDVTAEDMRPYLETYKRARLKTPFDESIAAAVRRVLVAPDFLFLLEINRAGAAPNSLQPVQEFELATRLSFFLWSSIPDEELLNVATRGKLKDPVVLKQQVTRMLADLRAQSLVDNFAMQWLGLRALGDALPDRTAYPEFDAALREDFAEESRLFLGSVIRENRSALDLLSSDYTFVNERLAKNYGISGVTGPGLRRVSLAGQPERTGVLGHGSILMMTSHTNKTSPVLRGNWILTNLLNSPPPPPPPGVPPLDESAVDGKPLTTRQQVERHRASPTCSNCHARMDPLGFALENFDVIGRWRTADAGGKIDPSGKLPNGEEVDGPTSVRKLLMAHADDFVGATVSRLMTFALGRQLDSRDQPAIRKIVRTTAAGRYKFAELILGVINSVPFRMRHVQEPS